MNQIPIVLEPTVQKFVKRRPATTEEVLAEEQTSYYITEVMATEIKTGPKSTIEQKKKRIAQVRESIQWVYLAKYVGQSYQKCRWLRASECHDNNDPRQVTKVFRFNTKMDPDIDPRLLTPEVERIVDCSDIWWSTQPCKCPATMSGVGWPTNLVRILDAVIAFERDGLIYSIPFLRPVSKAEVPGYYDLVKEPMDFSTVLARIHQGMYTSPSHVYADVNRVWQSCEQFNRLDSPVAVQMRIVKAVFEKLWADLQILLKDASDPALKPKPYSKNPQSVEEAVQHVDVKKIFPDFATKSNNSASTTNTANNNSSNQLTSSANATTTPEASSESSFSLSLDRKCLYLVKWRYSSYLDMTWEASDSIPIENPLEFFRAHNQYPLDVASASRLPRHPADWSQKFRDHTDALVEQATQVLEPSFSNPNAPRYLANPLFNNPHLIMPNNPHAGNNFGFGRPILPSRSGNFLPPPQFRPSQQFMPPPAPLGSNLFHLLPPGGPRSVNPNFNSGGEAWGPRGPILMPPPPPGGGGLRMGAGPPNSIGGNFAPNMLMPNLVGGMPSGPPAPQHMGGGIMGGDYMQQFQQQQGLGDPTSELVNKGMMNSLIMNQNLMGMHPNR